MGNQSAKDPSPSAPPDSVDSADHHIETKLQECFLSYSSGVSQLQFQHFKEMFSSCIELAELVFDSCCSHGKTGRNDTGVKTTQINQDLYVSCATHLSRMTNLQDQIDSTFSIFTLGKPTITIPEFHLLFRTSFTIGLLSTNLSADVLIDTALAKSMEKSLFSTETSVEKSDFLYWCGRHFPGLLRPVHSYICSVFSGHTYKTDNPAGIPSASILDGSSILSVCLLWAMSSYIPASYTLAAGSGESIPGTPSLMDVAGPEGWSLLYNSDSQGLSLNRFEHHVMSYAGPTLTFIKFEGHLYCIGADEEWCDKTSRWGGRDCFLLQVLPQYRAMQSGGEMLYLNIQDRKSPKGLYVGKDSRTTLIQIDEDFSTVKHYGINVPLQNVEVWGCASRDVLEAQRKQRQWEHQEANKHKNRKLKLEDWENNPDRQLLELGGIKTEHAER